MNYIIEHFKGGIDYSHQTNQGPALDLHIHNYYEIYLFIKGNVNFFLDSQTIHLKNGDLMLIRNDQVHGPKPLNNSSYERYIIHLPRKLILDLSNSEANLLSCFSQNTNNSIISVPKNSLHKLVALLNQLTEIHKTDCYGEELLTNALLTQILVLINSLFQDSPHMAMTNHLTKEVQIVLSFIQDNITRDINLTSLEKQFKLSRFHLNRLFKKEIGTTVYQYILLSRIALAKRLLETTSNVTEVCFNSGFNDYANFIRTFKNITGLSPKQYATQIYEQKKLSNK